MNNGKIYVNHKVYNLVELNKVIWAKVDFGTVLFSLAQRHPIKLWCFIYRYRYTVHTSIVYTLLKNSNVHVSRVVCKNHYNHYHYYTILASSESLHRYMQF